MVAPIPDNEALRLARLRALAVLDTEAEPLFDALTQAAARVTGSPIALLTLVDADRQWFKSNVGLPGVSETPRTSAFCAHTILRHDVLEIADAQRDPRFADNPLVTGSPHIRFYAGAPLACADGLVMGSLCVIDSEPRELSESQREVLNTLARAATEALELRRIALGREAVLQSEMEMARQREADALKLGEKLRASEAFLDRTGTLAGVGGWQLDVAAREILWTDETCRIHDLPPGYQPTLQEAMEFYPPEAREIVAAAIAKSLRKGTGYDHELPLTTASGRKTWVHVIASVELSSDGTPLRLVGAIQDVSIRKRVVSSLEASDRRFRKLFQHSLGLICTHDAEGVLLSVNPAAARSLGYSVGELLGRPLSEFMKAERHDAFATYLARVFAAGKDEGTLELVAKGGTLCIWQYQNVLDDEDEDPYVLGHAQDITERHQHALNLHELSLRDPLTSCYNRRFLDETVKRDKHAQWACISIDLNYFKQVNDTYGHQRGDEVLVEMAQFLAGHVRSGDAVIRLGGDEFMLLLRDAGEKAAQGVVDRLEQGRASAPVGFTLGWSMFGRNGLSLEQGLAVADRQLYEKRASRPESRTGT